MTSPIKYCAHDYNLSLAWLKHHFDLSHEYSRVGNLKARVIIPAVAQINEHSNLSVSWRQTKQGRTVVGFTFYFKLKEEGVPRRRGSLSRADIIAQAMCGETWEQAHARLSRAAC